MTKTIYTINTTSGSYDLIINPFGKPFLEQNPDVDIRNITDDSLLVDTRAAGKVTENVKSRMLAYAKAAEASGADGVLITCTSVVDACEYIKENIGIPAINIAEPVAEMAVEHGGKIGIMGTLPTSPGAIQQMIDIYTAKTGKTADTVQVVVDGAFDVLSAGDRAKHDEMVCQALYKLAKEVDVIAFAQVSMSLLKHEEVSIPVLKIGNSGYERISNMAK